MKKFQVSIHGVAPILMHDGRLADPTSPGAKALKAITSKRSKTDADHEEIAHREFIYGLWMTREGRPGLPGFALEAAIKEGGKKFKLGRQVSAGVFVEHDADLIYDGPTDPEALWQAGVYRFTVPVRVGMAKTMRCRPRFDEWSATFEATLNPEVLSADDLQRILEKAGAEIGLGDWRPRYGRFEVVGFDEVA